MLSFVPGRLQRFVGLALVALALLATLGPGREWLEVRLPASASDYDYHEEWRGYLATERDCPGAGENEADAATQEEAMLCLLNWARRRHGLQALERAELLMKSAHLKALDIARCDDFRHEACGKPPDATAARVGYGRGARRRAWAENIAWGTGPARSPRAIVDGWLASPGHRKNLLRPGWTEQGVALAPVRRFQGRRDASVWVSHFGARH